ncbi:hypothetical protein [Polynucleobacter necessarius]|uniref:hypothetical protein n=1 Tax=Polynucleobacter necessarius TaxID=576610 RepID=UPI000E09B838|nr:hypothetical protein [Polynucleobacter necessarius]HAT39667.1 hypothetical protein [Polynucleobacter sp.]
MPGSRILDGQFTSIQQAIATKKSNLEAIEYLDACLKECIRSGLVANLLQKYGVQDLSAAPIIKP